MPSLHALVVSLFSSCLFFGIVEAGLLEDADDAGGQTRDSEECAARQAILARPSLFDSDSARWFGVVKL